jgi:hypothetical protein
VIAGILFILMLVTYILLLYPERCMIQISRAVKSSQDVKALDAAVHLYHKETGHLPVTLDKLVPQFLGKIPLDPWGHRYQYTPEEKSLFVWGLGANGAKGGTGSNSDLTVESTTENIVSSIQGTFSCK